MLTKIRTAGIVMLAVTLLSACNTMEGAGKDIERAGDKIEDSARENNNQRGRY